MSHGGRKGQGQGHIVIICLLAGNLHGCNVHPAVLLLVMRRMSNWFVPGVYTPYLPMETMALSPSLSMLSNPEVIVTRQGPCTVPADSCLFMTLYRSGSARPCNNSLVSASGSLAWSDPQGCSSSGSLWCLCVAQGTKSQRTQIKPYLLCHHGHQNFALSMLFCSSLAQKLDQAGCNHLGLLADQVLHDSNGQLPNRLVQLEGNGLKRRSWNCCMDSCACDVQNRSNGSRHSPSHYTWTRNIGVIAAAVFACSMFGWSLICCFAPSPEYWPGT